MPFTQFSPNTVIKSSEINSNFNNTVHLTDTQRMQNKINVPAVTSSSPAAGDTVTLDLSAGNILSVTMPAGNITLALSNALVNQPFIIRITQDSVGSRTVTWFSTIKWPGGSAPVLSTGANKTDVFGFICTSSGNYDGYIIAQNL